MSTRTVYAIVTNAPRTFGEEHRPTRQIATRPTEEEAVALRAQFHEAYPGLTFRIVEEIELSDAGIEDYLRVEASNLRTELETYGQGVYLRVHTTSDLLQHLISGDTELADLLRKGDPSIAFEVVSENGSKTECYDSVESYLAFLREALVNRMSARGDLNGALNGFATTMLQRFDYKGDLSLFWRRENEVREGLEVIIDELTEKTNVSRV